ncbi:MAG: S9 family peptidase [Myxococcales bacterium]|nr:S9 family peptidase [Myxococcales bacterium]
MNLEQLLQLGQVVAVTPHPSGRLAAIAVTRLNSEKSKRISELWSIPLEGNSKPERLANHDDGCSAPAYGSDGTLYFLSKEKTELDDAAEVQQVWRRGADGRAQPVTDEPLGVVEFKVAGKTLVVLAKVSLGIPHAMQREVHRDRANNGPSGRMYATMNVRSWDSWTGGPSPHLIAYELGDGLCANRRDLCPNFDRELDAPHGLAWDLSADGRCVASASLRPGLDRLNDSSLLIIDTAFATQRHLGLSDRITHQDVRFSPSGASVATVQHLREARSHGPLRIAIYDVESGNVRLAAEGWDCSPSIGDWHGEGKLLVTAPHLGHSPVYKLCLEDDTVTRITSSTSGGTHSHISCSGNSLIGLRASFTRAPEVFVAQISPNAELRLCSPQSGMKGDAPLGVESLEARGDGGTAIQYFVLSPVQDNETKTPRPTLFWIHGGPVHSWTDGWHWRWNPLPFIDAGFNVVLPNPRGSTGFGQEFIEGIVGNEWGNACFHDLMAVADAVSARNDVDSKNMMAMGGSFGGYMSNWIGSQTERFAAIITHASLYRLSAFHGTTDWPAYWAHHMGLHPSDAPEVYDRYSPHRYVDQWKTPVLITHGEKDYRVPISEALMLFEDLQRRGVDARLLAFPDENHWILGPRNAELWYRSCLEFLAEHVSA